MSEEDYIFGLHAVDAALAQAADRIDGIWIDAQRDDQRVRHIISMARAAKVKVHRVPRAKLDTLAQGRHQGVVARYRAAPVLSESALPELLGALDHPPLLLVLDEVQDPHNLGACLRSADAAGVDIVIIPRDQAAPINATVRRVACGATESLKILQVTNLARALQGLRDAGIWLVGTAGDADQSLYDVDLKGPIAMVMGGEEGGLRRLTREACDFLARLPMRGQVESLNVSVACGICLYEAVRQRGA